MRSGCTGIDRRAIPWPRWLLWAMYMALVGYARLYHQPYVDEVDSWVIARDATAYDFWHYFSSSGHPPLWYATLWPFAHVLHLPVEFEGVIHLAIAGAAAWLLLFCAPLPLWLTAPAVFSFQLAYQYAVIARGYSLMLLMLYAAVALYPRRFQRPLCYAAALGMAANTEIWAWPIAGLLALFHLQDGWRAYKRRQPLWPGYRRALLLMALAGALAFFSMWPLGRENPAYHAVTTDPGKFIGAVSEGFIPLNNTLNHFATVGQVPPAFHFLLDIAYGRPIAALALLLLSLALFQWHPRALLLWAAWLGCFFYVATFVYITDHHDAMVPFLLLWVLWFAGVDPPCTKKPNALARRWLYTSLCLCFLFSAFMNGLAIAYERGSDYSAGPATAQFLKAHLAPDRPLIVLGCYIPVAATAYLPGYRIYLAGESRYGSYYLWTSAMVACNSATVERQLAHAETLLPERRGLWVLSDDAVPFPEKHGLTERYAHKGFKDEFRVYQYR